MIILIEIGSTVLIVTLVMKTLVVLRVTVLIILHGWKTGWPHLGVLSTETLILIVIHGCYVSIVNLVIGGLTIIIWMGTTTNHTSGYWVMAISGSGKIGWTYDGIWH